MSSLKIGKDLHMAKASEQTIEWTQFDLQLSTKKMLTEIL